MCGKRRSLTHLVVSLGLASSSACRPAIVPVEQHASPPLVSSEADPSLLEARLDPRLSALVAQKSKQGVMVTYDTDTHSLRTSDLSLCRQGFHPGATFHVPALLIGMETGIWGSLDDLVPWDGQVREIAQWNQDQTVRRAFESACFPCFGQVMRTAGSTTVRQFLHEFGYGNALPEPIIDSFWLSGALRISPLGQIEFLWRLDRGLLPVHQETRGALLQVFSLDHRDGRTLRGKSGRFTTGTDQGDWMVGWLESGRRRYFFSLLLLGPPGEDLEQERTLVLDEWLSGLVEAEQQSKISRGEPANIKPP